MGVATTTATPVEQVDDLIRQVADEAGLDVAAQVVVERCADADNFLHKFGRKDYFNLYL